jgi:branched-chain amino acid transport system substrate-binding protein
MNSKTGLIVLFWSLLLTILSLSLAVVYPRIIPPPSNEPMVKLGLIAPLTGARASLGQDALDGARLALDEINSAKLPGEPMLELAVEDSQAETLKGLNAYKKLKTQGTKFMLTYNSNVSLPISQLVNHDDILQLALSTTSAQYSTAGDLTFRVNGTTQLEGEYIGRFVSEKMQRSPGTLAILAMEDQYPMSLRDSVYSALDEKQAAAIVQETFLPGTSDFRATIAKLKNQGVNYVVFLGYPVEGGYFVKQQKELGLNPLLIIGNVPLNSPEFFAVAKDSADGVVIAYITVNAEHPAAKKFSSRYSREATYSAANGYDAVEVAHAALRKCGFALKTACLRDALYSIKNFDGMSGRKSFDGIYGDMEDNYGMLIAKNRKFVANLGN